MEVYSYGVLESYFNDLMEVGSWVLNNIIRNFLQTVYASNSWNFLFYTALLPFVFMFSFDLIFTLIFSIHLKEFRFFNILSVKSWRLFSEQKFSRLNVPNVYRSSELRNKGESLMFRFTRVTPFLTRLSRYSRAKCGDVIRCKDGERFVYVGMRLSADNKPLYAYRNGSGVYYSLLKPVKWSASSGSVRGTSIVDSYKNKK